MAGIIADPDPGVGVFRRPAPIWDRIPEQARGARPAQPARLRVWSGGRTNRG